MKLKTKRMKVWCHKTNKGVGWVGSDPKAAPKTMRCPDCNKQLKTIVQECHDPGCWHVYMPAHKKFIKEKKDDSRNENVGRERGPKVRRRM